jgi:N6-adenosine-specific RNA methylase IME4
VPWRYIVRSDKGLERSAENHYDTMALDQITGMGPDVTRIMTPNSRLFFWVTGPFFAIGAHVPIMRAWGFEPVAVVFVWVKPNKRDYMENRVLLTDEVFKMNMGHTSRQNAEFVVLGRRGNPPPRLSKAIRQIIVEPAREHSRKPRKFYSRVESYAAGPYLDLFGRQQRPGWIVRGNESKKFRARI